MTFITSSRAFGGSSKSAQGPQPQIAQSIKIGAHWQEQIIPNISQQLESLLLGVFANLQGHLQNKQQRVEPIRMSK
jgi:hypothetical protein